MKLEHKINMYIRYLLRGFKTDNIEFTVSIDYDYSEDPEGFPWKHTDVLINKKSIFDRLREYELSEARRTKTNIDLAGNYVGIDPHSVVKIFKLGNFDLFSLWQCSICKSSLCASDLICKCKVTPFTVELYDFRQQSKPVPFNNSELHNSTIEKSKWNYSAFGPFKFSKIDLYKELSKLAKTSYV